MARLIAATLALGACLTTTVLAQSEGGVPPAEEPGADIPDETTPDDEPDGDVPVLEVPYPDDDEPPVGDDVEPAPEEPAEETPPADPPAERDQDSTGDAPAAPYPPPFAPVEPAAAPLPAEPAPDADAQGPRKGKKRGDRRADRDRSPAPAVPNAVVDSAPAPADPDPEGSSPKDRLERYNPRSEPKKVVDTTVAAFVLLQLAGGGGLALAGMGLSAGGGAGAAAGRGGTGARSKERGGRKQEKVRGAKVKHIKGGPEGEARGDRSRIWRWPGTPAVDSASLALPPLLARHSPLLGRVAADGGCLRAMLGSAWVCVPVAGAALGALAVNDVSGEALPPALALTIAIAVLGILDASAGFSAVLVFVLGVAALGGIDSAAAGRTLLGLCGIWFAVPLLAGAARPLRRPPATDPGERFDRLADFVIASLIGAWVVQKIVESLPGLAGYELPISGSANTIALSVLAALIVRMGAESLASNLFPERLAAVHPGQIPWPPEKRQLVGVALRSAIFVFVAIAAVDSSWQLWLGAVLFLIPQLLKIYERRLPTRPALQRVVPEGLLKVVVMLFVMSICASVVLNALSDSPNLIANAFVLLAVPGCALSVLGALAGDAAKTPMTWRYRFGGAIVLGAGVLQASGFLL